MTYFSNTYEYWFIYGGNDGVFTVELMLKSIFLGQKVFLQKRALAHILPILAQLNQSFVKP